VFEFDMRALQAALDSERRARGLTWDELAWPVEAFETNAFSA
jgi:hypothetical protein